MSDLQDELDRHEAAHWNNRLTKDSLIVEAARKWDEHEGQNAPCLRGITAVEDPDFEMEAPDGQ